MMLSGQWVRDRDEWGDLYRSCPHASPFLHPDVADALARYGQRPICIRTDGSQDSHGGLFVAHADDNEVGTSFGYNGFATTAGTSPAGDPSIAIARTLRERFEGPVQIKPAPGALPIFSEPWIVTPRDPAIVIDLVHDVDPSSGLLSGRCSKSMLRNVRLATNRGLRVEECTQPFRFEEFYGEYTENMRAKAAHRRFVFDRDFFTRSVPRLLELSLCRMYVALDDRDRFRGGLLVFRGVGVTYSGMLALDEGAKADKVSDLLYARSAVLEKESGQTDFVLGGGNASGDSLYQYKARFSRADPTPSCVMRLDPRS